MIWMLLALALVFSFLLSGLESAVLSVSRVRLRHRFKTRERAAARLVLLFRHRERLLSATLVLNNSLNLLVFAIATRQLVDLLGNRGYALSVAVCLPVYVIALELFPKSLFKRFPYRALSRFHLLLEVVYHVIGPFMLTGPITRRLHKRRSSNAMDREGFKSLTNIIEREGKLGSYEKQLIQGVLDFNRVTAGEVMIPLSRVTAIPLEMPVGTALEIARETKLHQFPVMSPKGDLVGAFDAFEVLLERPEGGRVVQHLHRLLRTHPQEKAIGVIRLLCRSGVQLAAVYTPAGRPLGIVSARDLVRRLLCRD